MSLLGWYFLRYQRRDRGGYLGSRPGGREEGETNQFSCDNYPRFGHSSFAGDLLVLPCVLLQGFVIWFRANRPVSLPCSRSNDSTYCSWSFVKPAHVFSTPSSNDLRVHVNFRLGLSPETEGKPGGYSLEIVLRVCLYINVSIIHSIRLPIQQSKVLHFIRNAKATNANAAKQVQTLRRNSRKVCSSIQ